MRVVIADDDVLLRHGLVALLRDAQIEVAATAGDAETLVAVVREVRPDVLLTDIRMPPHHADDGLLAARALRAELPGLAVMVLSQFVLRRYALELVGDDPKGVGYQLKQRIGDVDAFVADLHRIAAGGTALDPEVVRLMLTRAEGGHDRIGLLTTRQREVLGLIAEGRSNAAIAARLHITEKAVVAHMSRIYAELDLSDNDGDHRRVLAALRFLNA